MSFDTDIIIVGAGPAGLSLAAALGKSGLKITLIEKHTEGILAAPPYDGREIALTHVSKNIMERLGMWQHIEENDIYPLRDAKVLNGHSSYQLHFPAPTSAAGKPTDRLGFLVSNHHIRRAAYQAAQSFNNIHFLTETGVKQVYTSDSHAEVILDDGQKLSSRLFVAADSRFSQTRRQLGIACDMHDYGRTMFVCRMKHTLSNQHTAYECFHYGRTLALLPLEEYLTNTVITVDSDQAHEIENMAPEVLAATVQQQLNNRLGDMELVSTVHAYPLVGTLAEQFYGTRSALIGDAAVGMHPVTAHGFNLGLGSADRLANLIQSAAQQGRDIAAKSLLMQYNQQHMLHAKPLYKGTNLLLKLFTDETPPAKVLRNVVLRASNHFPPIKQLITKQLTG